MYLNCHDGEGTQKSSNPVNVVYGCPKKDSSFYLKYQGVIKMCQQVTINDNRQQGAMGQIKR